MKTTALLLFLSLSLPAYADFAQVIDSDGYANIRSQPSPNAKIVGKVPDGAIVALSYDEEDDGWRLINYPTPQGRTISGVIHYSRLKPIHTYPELPSASSGNQFACSAGPYRLTVNTGAFDFLRHRRNFTEIYNKEYDFYTFTHYKGKPAIGTDGMQPDLTYRSIVLNGKQGRSAVPEADFENLFQPNAQYHSCFYNRKTDTIYLFARNSDGAGSYNALFIFTKGRYIKRLIDDGQS